MPSRDLDRPIFIIGAARSGTTLLGDILARHSAVAYWVEPKYVWRYRSRRSGSDRRLADEATPRVERYIRGRFSSYVARRGKQRFVEKTPSNCFRVPFIHRLFPRGRFVHILRDGRDVTLSARRAWSSPVDRVAFRRRLTSLEIPLVDLPWHLPAFLRALRTKALRRGPETTWGPRFPGIEAAREDHTPLQLCALQWKESVETAWRDLEAIDERHRITIGFEDLVRAPERQVRAILDFCDLPCEPELLRYAAGVVRPSAAERWRQAEPGELDEFVDLIGETLQRCGYPV